MTTKLNALKKVRTRWAIRCYIRTLLFDLVVQLPEAQGARGRFRGQLAVVLHCKLKRCFVYTVLNRLIGRLGSASPASSRPRTSISRRFG
jgi:hypothetical protein